MLQSRQEEGRVASVNRSEHEQLSRRFGEAVEIYEDVVVRKGPWLRNLGVPQHYSDPRTIADLERSLRILTEIREILEDKPDADEWLLHMAGIHWQSALALFLLERYDEAESENDSMWELIPRVPIRMWGRGQMQDYQSNYYFLSGELAVARSDSEHAIAQFEMSKQIDLKHGNYEGVRKCDQYLRALGKLPSATNIPRVLTGKAVFLLVGFGTLLGLGRWTGMDVWKPTGARGVLLFVVSAVAGVIADRLLQRSWRGRR